MCIHSAMLRRLIRGLLVLLWIAAGIMPSVSANAMSDATAGSGMHSGEHGMHMQHSAASDEARIIHPGGCQGGNTADDGGATCCQSMCQTVDLVISTISFQPVAAGTRFVAAKPDERTSIPAPLAERPPQTS